MHARTHARMHARKHTHTHTHTHTLTRFLNIMGHSILSQNCGTARFPSTFSDNEFYVNIVGQNIF